MAEDLQHKYSPPAVNPAELKLAMGEVVPAAGRDRLCPFAFLASRASDRDWIIKGAVGPPAPTFDAKIQIIE